MSQLQEFENSLAELAASALLFASATIRCAKLAETAGDAGDEPAERTAIMCASVLSEAFSKAPGMLELFRKVG